MDEFLTFVIVSVLLVSLMGFIHVICEPFSMWELSVFSFSAKRAKYLATKKISKQKKTQIKEIKSLIREAVSDGYFDCYVFEFYCSENSKNYLVSKGYSVELINIPSLAPQYKISWS